MLSLPEGTASNAAVSNVWSSSPVRASEDLVGARQRSYWSMSPTLAFWSSERSSLSSWYAVSNENCRANSPWALGFVHRGALVERHRQDWSCIRRVFLATGVQRPTGISVLWIVREIVEGQNDNKDNKDGSHHLGDHLGASTSGNTRIVPSSTL